MSDQTDSESPTTTADSIWVNNRHHKDRQPQLSQQTMGISILKNKFRKKNQQQHGMASVFFTGEKIHATRFALMIRSLVDVSKLADTKLTQTFAPKILFLITAYYRGKAMKIVYYQSLSSVVI